MLEGVPRRARAPWCGSPSLLRRDKLRHRDTEDTCSLVRGGNGDDSLGDLEKCSWTAKGTKGSKGSLVCTTTETRSHREMQPDREGAKGSLVLMTTVSRGHRDAAGPRRGEELKGLLGEVHHRGTETLRMREGLSQRVLGADRPLRDRDTEYCALLGEGFFALFVPFAVISRILHMAFSPRPSGVVFFAPLIPSR